MKRKRAANSREMVIKCCLKGHLQQAAIPHLPSLQRRIDSLSRFRRRGSLLVNHFIIFCMENDLALPAFSFNDITKLFTKGIANQRVFIPSLNEFYAQHQRRYEWKEEDRFPYDNDAFNYAMKDYFTCFVNSLVANTKKRQYSYLTSMAVQLQIEKADIHPLRCAINGWATNNPLRGNKMARLRVFIRAQRLALGLGRNDSLNAAFINTHLVDMVRYQYMMLRGLEANGCSGFTIAPMHQNRRYFMHVSKNVMYGLMQEAGMFAGNNEAFHASYFYHFNRFFKLRKLVRKRLKFTGFLSTDGVAISFHFDKTVQQAEEAPPPANPARLIAIDPGRANIIYAVEQLADGRYNKWKLTRKDLYSRAHINKNRKRVERENQLRTVKRHIEALSVASLTVGNLRTFEKNLDVHLRYQSRLFNHFNQHKMARWR